MFSYWIQKKNYVNQVVCNYEKENNGLKNILSSQKYVNDQIRLGYSKFEISNHIKKTIFVNLTMFVTMFNLEKYVIMIILERQKDM